MDEWAIYRRELRREQQLRRLESTVRQNERRRHDRESWPEAGTGHAPAEVPGRFVAPSAAITGSADDAVLRFAAPVLGVAALPLLVGHAAALLVNGGFPRYPLSDAPGIMARLAADPGAPGAAWEPVNTGTAVPGPGGYWLTFVFVVVIVGLVVLLAWSALRRPATRRGAAWAPADSLRSMWRQKGEVGLAVGSSSGRVVTVRDLHGLIVIGPAHSGKTSGVVVPAVVEWPGPVIVASTKGHLIDETIGWRSHQGDVHVYDPAGITRYHRSGWSLLHGCDTWDRAIRTATDLTLAALASSGASNRDRMIVEGRGDVWRSSMAMTLAPFLLAAAVSGRSIRTVTEWIQNDERDEVLEILQGGHRNATRAHRNTFARDDEIRSRYFVAMHEILSVYADPIVAASMDRHEIEPAELLDGGAHTLYLTAPEYDQDRLRPLCAMIMRQVLSAAFEASAGAGRPLDPPLLVVFDDLPGVAPVYDLASLASTAPARGVQLLSVLQDLERLTDQYGDDADLVVRNHRARLVLPAGPGGVTGGLEDVLPPALARTLDDGEAALLYSSHEPARVRLRSWWRDRELQRRVEMPQDAVRAVEPDDERHRQVSAPMSQQREAWLRRSGRAQPPDPTIPVDLQDPTFIEVFGSVDEEPVPQNVTSLLEPRRPRK